MGGANQGLRIAPEELHGERLLLGVVRRHLAGTRRLHEERERIHLFRGGEAAPAFTRDQAEGCIGDGGHGGQPAQLTDLDRADLHG